MMRSSSCLGLVSAGSVCCSEWKPHSLALRDLDAT